MGEGALAEALALQKAVIAFGQGFRIILGSMSIWVGEGVMGCRVFGATYTGSCSRIYSKVWRTVGVILRFSADLHRFKAHYNKC